MKTTPVLILAAVAAAVVIIATLVARKERIQSPEAAPAALAPMFDGLQAKLPSVAAIAIKQGDKEFSLRKAGETWQIPERGGYPAKVEEVKRALFQLGELRQGEQKTTKPELYAQLGVQDPDGKPIKEGETGPTLVVLKDDKDQPVASIIVGKAKQAAKPGVFIRKSGDAQSWLAEGALEIPGDSIRWIDTSVINIPRERMKGATSTQPDGSTVRVFRNKPEDASFTVADLPAGKELKYAGAGDQLATVLGGLTIDDVAVADQIDFEGKAGGKPAGYCEFRTFDGLMIAAQLAEKDGKTWARFSAYSEAAPEAAKPAEGQPPEAKPAKSPEDVKKEADELNARLAKWAYVIPQWKLTAFNTRMTDLIKSDEPPKPPPSLEGTTPLIPPPAPK